MATASRASLGLWSCAALGAVWLITLVNLRSVKGAGFVQVARTVLKFLPLFFVGTLGLMRLQSEYFIPCNPTDGSGGAGIAASAVLTLRAFLGLKSATVPAGDVKNPSKTIPLATVFGVTFAAALYLLVTIAVFRSMPRENIAQWTALGAAGAQIQTDTMRTDAMRSPT